MGFRERPLILADLDTRSREIFRRIVHAYVETGEPIGSRTLSQLLKVSLSPATIRNVMADLEGLGLIRSPHASAGRIPTEEGLRFFVDDLLEVSGLTVTERTDIDSRCLASGRDVSQVLEDATGVLADLSHCAGLVMAPKSDRALKHIEFVSLAPGRALVVIVSEDGLVENRAIDVPLDIPESSFTTVSNYLSARLAGCTIAEAKAVIEQEITAQQAEIDQLISRMAIAGLAAWTTTPPRTGLDGGYLIVRGQSHLLGDVTALSDLERIRTLLQALEAKEAMARLLEATHRAGGIQIFIGAQSELFSLVGCSVVIAPYLGPGKKIVGAIGVVGPTRIDYARVISLVDYTAKAIGRVLGESSKV